MHFKKLVSFFIFLPFILLAQESMKSGYTRFYYENGTLSSEGTLRDGKPDGYWKTYFTSGKIKSEGNRKNFSLDSTWKFYFENGKMSFIYNYTLGRKNGFKSIFTESGILTSEETYKEDIRQGTTYFYHPNGKVKQMIQYEKGLEEGNSFELDSNGLAITVYEYHLGFIRKQEKINRRDKNGLKQSVWKEFYPNGNLKNECKYTDDKKDGFLKEYAIDGSLINATKWVNGVLQTDVPELAKIDVKTEYQEGGVLKFSGGYKNGIAEGVHRFYAPDGKLVNSKIFREGILAGEGIFDEEGREQGNWKEFHANGQLRSKGEYKNGKRIGDWVFYHPNGKQEQFGHYDEKGRTQGVWKWYYESGNLLREEKYADGVLQGMMTEYSDTLSNLSGDGKVITKGLFQDGVKEGLWTYELGDYREDGNYRFGKRDGNWKHFYSSGKLRFEGNYVDGEPEGKHLYYFPDGRVMQEGLYTAGRKENDWLYYNEEGLLSLTITFKNDIEVKFDGVKVKPTNEEITQQIKLK